MKNSVQIGVTAAILLLVGAYIFHEETFARRQAQARLVEHAGAVSVPLWNFDRQASVDYLAEAAQHDHYEKLTVTTTDGTEFYSSTGRPLGTATDRLLARLGLMPEIPLHANVTYNGKIIGQIHALARSRTIYPDLYAALVGLLLIYIAHLYLRQLHANRDLDAKVRARTAELLANGEALRRLNRDLVAISACNQTLIHAENENKLLQDICRIVCEKAGYNLAWVGYAEPDEAKTVRPVVWAGSENGYLTGANISWADTERGQGPTGTAIRTGKTTYMHDLATDPRTAPWRERILQREFHSSIALPLKDEHDHPFAALTIYSTEVNAFSPEEICLLEELAGDLAFGIKTIRLRTQRHSAEQELLKEKALSDAVINSLPGVFYMFDREGRVLRSNDEFVKQIAAGPRSMATHRLGDLIIEEDKEKVRAAVECAYAEGQAGVEARVVTTSAGVRHYHFVARRLQIDGQSFLVGSGYDITERKRAEEAFLQSNARLQLLLGSTNDGFVVVNMTGQILEFNHAYVEMLGYTEEELRQMSYQDLTPEKWRAAEDRIIRDQLLATGRAEAYEKEYRRKDGAFIPVELRTDLLRNPAGEIIGMCAIIRNITERKRLENQLRQAQKMEAIGQLAGGIAHDFNNILAATMMNLDFMKTNPSLDQESREVISELEAEAKRAASLTRQLLMFSRRSVLESRVLDVNEVVATLLKMLGRLLGEDVRLVFERGNDLPCVEADAGMLEQVLMNLVVNARDAMPNGGRITIATSSHDFTTEQASAAPNRRPGRFVALSVSDTGCGMDADTLKRIFEPFFTTKEAGKGTGLGLATTYGIMSQHKGWVEVESQVKQGSTFRVFLPATHHVAADAQPKKPESPPTGKETILLVEDDSSVRRTLIQTLRLLGYRVLEASNGQEATLLWRKHGREIDLLFTDMIMPEGMTGLELAERVRSDNPRMRIVISSGYSAEISKTEKITAAGMVYLPKPYQLPLLGKIVREALDRK